MSRARSAADEEREALLHMLKIMGLCLLLVQLAERGLTVAVDEILDDPDVRLMEQGEAAQKQTLGALLRKLKRKVKLEYKLKEKLYRFLEMRNKFVHDVRKIEGWDLRTTKGREIAVEFMAELLSLSVSIGSLFAAMMRAYERELGLDPNEDRTKVLQEFGDSLDKHMGQMAKDLLAARYRKPLLKPA